MFVNSIPYGKEKRKMVVLQTRYVDSDGKTRTKTVEKLGYLDELEKIYPDPIKHFKQVAIERTKEENEKKKDNIINLILQKDGIMPFDGNGKYDSRLKLGNAPIAWVINQLELDKLVKGKKQYTNIDYNLTNLLRLFLYERILSPSSKKRDWENRKCYYEKMDFKISQIYTGLQQLGKWKDDILESLNKKMCSLYGRKQGFGFFDGTNVYYEIENEDGYRMRGVSKENRPLPLTQLGVLLDSEGFPISYDVYSGNTNDTLMLKPAMERARSKYGLRNMIYVADKGFYSGDTIADAIVNHDGYVISNSVRGNKIDEELRKTVLDRSDYTFIGSDGKTQDSFSSDTIFMYKVINLPGKLNVKSKDGSKKVVKGAGRYIISFWSRKYSERAKIDRMATVEKAAVKSMTNSKSKVDNTYGSNAFLKTAIKDKEGNLVEDYKAQVLFNQEALDKVEELDGFYLIETNLAGKGWFGDERPFKEGEDARWREDWGMLQLNRTLEPLDIVEIYRGLWKIEDSFKIMKSFLEMRPVYVSSKESIEGHFLICFLSLLIVRILERRTDNAFTTEEIITSLRKSEIAEINTGTYINLYYDRVLQSLAKSMDLPLNQKAFTQKDLRNLYALTRKANET